MSGGAPSTLVTGMVWPVGMMADESGLYWMDSGRVMKMAR